MGRWRSLALFPGLWFACCLCLLAVRFGGFSTWVVGTMVGFVTYIAALLRADPESYDASWSRAHAALVHVLVSVQRLSTFLGIVAATGVIVGTFNYFVVDDPIGLEGDAGWASGPCSIQELKSVSNSSDETAHVRYSTCPAGGPLAIIAVDDFTYFVFVHKVGEPNSADGLALRYDALGDDVSPEIRWVAPSRFVVTVHRADVGRVTKQRTRVDGIEIVYHVEN